MQKALSKNNSIETQGAENPSKFQMDKVLSWFFSLYVTAKEARFEKPMSCLWN